MQGFSSNKEIVLVLSWESRIRGAFPWSVWHLPDALRHIEGRGSDGGHGRGDELMRAGLTRSQEEVPFAAFPFPDVLGSLLSHAEVPSLAAPGSGPA